MAYVIRVRGHRSLFTALCRGLLLLLLALAWVAGAGVRISGGATSARSDGAVGVVPVSLATVASRTIGDQGRSFLITRQGGALVASGGSVSSSFSRTGVHVTAAHGTARISLLGVGYGSRLASMPMVAPVSAARTVTYHLGQLVEWYRNGPSGLEQGFTLAARPALHGPGRLTLAFGLSGLVARRSADGVVLASGDGRAVLSYGRLSVRDADGRSLGAQIVPRGARLLLQIQDRDARYPLRIDPLIEAQELAAPTSGPDQETGDGQFGWSAALAPDGNTAVIGAPYTDSDGAGAAWVFTRSGGTWTEQEKLSAPDTGPDQAIGKGFFGSSVALSADGDTVLIGGNEDNSAAGAAWVYTRSGNSWTEQQKLIAPASGPDGEIGAGQFGWSVALSPDGQMALIGGTGDNSGAGAAWVYVRSPTAWGEQQKLAPTAGGGGFGSAVTISSDGSTALIGAAPIGPGGVGAAWVFTHSPDGWSEQHVITAPATGPDQEIGDGLFGTSVALSSDGNTALIGSYDGTTPSFGGPPSPGPGAAWVYTRSEGAWFEQQKLTAPTTGPDAAIGSAQFGGSVAMSSDARTAIIGGDTDANVVDGAAWVFTSSGGSWSEQQKLTAPSGYSDPDSGNQVFFGSSVTLSGDGDTSLVGSSGGGPFGEASGPFGQSVGAAWWFTSTPAVSSVGPDVGSRLGGTSVMITGQNLDGASAVSFGGSPAASFSVISPTEIDAVSPPGSPGQADVVVSTSAGASATDAADQFTYTADVPGASSAVSAVAGDGQATVSFADPAANGSPITQYTVTAAPGGARATGTGSPITVAGLSNGTPYSFTVTATNAVGTGSPSAPSNAVVPSGPSARAALSVVLPRTVCARVSVGRGCLAQPRRPGVVLAPGGVGWRGTLRLTTSSGAAVAGATVEVIDGSWSATVRTGASGSASFAVGAGDNRSVRLVFAGTPSDQAAAASVKIEDRPISMLRLVPGVGGHAKALLAGVDVGPTGARAAVAVRLQILRSRKWMTVAVAHSSKLGWWNAIINRPRRGLSRFRTVIDATPSTPVTIRLR